MKKVIVPDTQFDLHKKMAEAAVMLCKNVKIVILTLTATLNLTQTLALALTLTLILTPIQNLTKPSTII